MATPVVVLLQVLGIISVVMSLDSSPSCSCGVFKTDQLQNQTEPLHSHEAFKAGCDNLGDARCKSMCVALATLSREKAPSILCAALKGDIEPFKPVLFWRNCDTKWIFSGLVGTDTISCHLGKPI